MNDTERKRDLLRSSGFFRQFSPDVLESILPKLQPCHFSADQTICQKGDESDSLYLIGEGKVEISVSSRDGKVIVLGTLSAGDVFGEIGLLDKEARTADVIAKSDARLYKLGTQDFDEAMKAFGLNEWVAITQYICLMFRRVTNNLEETSFLDTGIRIIKKILEIHDKSPEEEQNAPIFKLNISQEVLGRMVGLSREATNKTLARLADDGLIESKYKHLLIPDIKRLRAIVRKEEI